MPHFSPRLQGAAVGLAVGAAAAASIPLLLASDAEGPSRPAATTASERPAASGRTTAPRGTVVQAEDLEVRASVGQPFDDAEAGSGRGLMLFADGAVSATIPAAIERPVIRVRGDQCDGPPQMRVRVNGKKVLAMPISDEQWRTVVIDVPRSDRASNVISIAYFDDSGRPGCDRNLLLDWIAADSASAEQALADEATPPGENAKTPAMAGEDKGDRTNASPSTRDSGSADPADSGAENGAAAAGGDSAAGRARSGLFVDPSSAAARYARGLGSGRSGDRRLIETIADQPQALWLGDWDRDVGRSAAAVLERASRQKARAVFVAYAIPGRDCGSYSAGGLPADTYTAWIDDLARAIGSAPATVVLEPDALPQADCLDAAARRERYALLRGAVAKLGALPATKVYLDAGHSNWKSADEMARRLRQAGIAQADGFALNTSNYGRTADEVRYGRLLSARVGGKPFVVDTSRNGRGPDGSAWCNPSGRALGEAPTTNTGLAGVDAFLWIKRPGESDGTCNGGPAAGEFWPAAAMALARNAG